MHFDLQPTLVGEFVRLEPLRPSHFDELFAVASDPLIWEQHPDRLRHQRESFQKFFDTGVESGEAFLARDAQSGEVIGSSRYFGLDEEESSIEIGWTFLARKCWGGKYNADMKQLLLSHAFQFVDRVLFIVGVDNVRSQRAVERLGAQRAGTRPDANGFESLIYELRAGEFAAREE